MHNVAVYSTSPLHSDGTPQALKWLPATVDVAAVLWRSDEVELAMAAVTATPEGVAFELRAMMRNPRRRDAGAAVGGPADDGRLRVGLELSDRTRLTARMLGEYWPPEERTGAVLVEEGGSGGDRSFVHRFVAGILPPGGGLDVVFQWPDMDVPLTRYHIDTEPFSEAAGRAQRAW